MSEELKRWTNGVFTIEQMNADTVKVTRKMGGFAYEATLPGGDFETVLSTLFTGATVVRKGGDDE